MDLTALSLIVPLLSVLLLTDITFAVRQHFRRLCKASEIEILSNVGVHIEPYDKSRVKLSLGNYLYIDPSDSPRFELEFEFKTTSPNGILFYGRAKNQPNELLGVVLQNGSLMHKIKCSNLHADVLVRTRDSRRVDDGRWHRINYTVLFRHYRNVGYVEIDNFSGIRPYDLGCENMTSLIIGGHEPGDENFVQSLESPGHFEGCIKNVNLNFALLSPPSYYAVSGCE